MNPRSRWLIFQMGHLHIVINPPRLGAGAEGGQGAGLCPLPPQGSREANPPPMRHPRQGGRWAETLGTEWTDVEGRAPWQRLPEVHDSFGCPCCGERLGRSKSPRHPW